MITDAELLIGHPGTIMKGKWEFVSEPDMPRWDYYFLVMEPKHLAGEYVHKNDCRIIGTPHDINGDKIEIGDIIAVAFNVNHSALLDIGAVTKIQETKGRTAMKKVQILRRGKKQTIDPANRTIIIKKRI